MEGRQRILIKLLNIKKKVDESAGYKSDPEQLLKMQEEIKQKPTEQEITKVLNKMKNMKVSG